MGVDQALSKMTQCAQPTLGLHEKTVLFGLRKTFFQNFAEIGESQINNSQAIPFENFSVNWVFIS